MSRQSHRPQKSTPRQLRVAEEIRRMMVEIFARAHWREPVLLDATITVSGARVSPDLKNVTIYCTSLGGEKNKEIVEALNRAKSYLRGELGHMLTLRYTPHLAFELDRSFDEAQHIEDLLRSEKVARDLKHEEPDDGP